MQPIQLAAVVLFVVEFVELFQADFELERDVEVGGLSLQWPRTSSEYLNVEVDFERDFVLRGVFFESLVDLHTQLNVVEHALQLGGVFKATRLLQGNK